MTRKTWLGLLLMLGLMAAVIILNACGSDDAQKESFRDRARTVARGLDDEEHCAILLADLTTVRSSPDKT